MKVNMEFLPEMQGVYFKVPKNQIMSTNQLFNSYRAKGRCNKYRIIMCHSASNGKIIDRA